MYVAMVCVWRREEKTAAMANNGGVAGSAYGIGVKKQRKRARRIRMPPGIHGVANGVWRMAA